MILTEKQGACIRRALEGHNFMIIGKAGTGKSFIAKEIMKQFSEAGKRFNLVCSTGVSCEVYKEEEWLLSGAKILNSFFGIGMAKGSFDEIVNKAITKSAEKLRKVDAIIWDEFSINSSRDLELINSVCCKSRDSSLPFGGIQFILIGDWLQLSPVPDHIHVTKQNAKMYHSPIFKRLLKHSIELDRLFRQNEEETLFVNVLEEFRVGECSDTSLKFIEDVLAKPLEKDDEVTHLCFTRMEEDFQNTTKLRCYDGEMYTYISKDQGKFGTSVVPKRVIAKSNVPMICLANINEKIHNGTRCKFVKKIDDGKAQIAIDGCKYVIERWSWTSHDRDGVVNGSRKQIPLKLNWASTVHKAQGSQLSKIIIHSDYEFTGGLLYVALSRVKSHKDVCIVGFSRDHLIQREREIDELDKLQFEEFLDDASCCRDEITASDAAVSKQMDANNGGNDNVEDETQSEIGIYENVENEFAMENVPVTEEDRELHLELVLENLEQSENELDQPPGDFDYVSFLVEMKDCSVMKDSEFSQSKNKVIDAALAFLLKTQIFIQILWRKIFFWLRNHVKEQLSDTTFSTSFIKDVAKKVWFITRDAHVQSLLMVVLSGEKIKSTLEEAEICFCSDLSSKIFNLLLDIIAQSVRHNLTKAAVSNFKVAEMDPAGLSKIRYLGGYVVHVLLQQAQNYLSRNMSTDQAKVQRRTTFVMKKVKLLRTNLVVPYERLCTTTKYPETLSCVEERQFSSRGLLHTSDEMYEFMIDLEQARVTHLQITKAQTMGDKFLEHVKKEMVEDARFTLRQTFFGLFNRIDGICSVDEVQDLAMEMFEDVVNLYIRIGAKEILKDFKRCYILKKTMAHRHMVMMRKEKSERKNAKVSMDDFRKDQSKNKVDTFTKMKGSILRLGDAYLWTVYKVAEIKRLCCACNVELPSRIKRKLDIAKALLPAIKDMNEFKSPFYLDDLQARLHEANTEGNETEGNGPIRLTINVIRV